MDSFSINGANNTSPSPPTTGQVAARPATNIATHPATAEQTSENKKSYSAEQVSKAVDAINKTIQAASQNLELSVDKDNNQVIVKVIDQQTKQVLRQIPTEEAIDIANSLSKLQGLLIRQIA